MMPPWFADLGRLLIGVASLIVSLGVTALVWKLAWVMRGRVELENRRAQINENLVALVGEFMALQKVSIEEQRRANELQRETNTNLWGAIQVHGMRINRLSTKLGAPIMGDINVPE
jgi:hypothetical protein